MGQRETSLASDAAALGEVRLDEGAVLSAKFAERMERFDHARALRPAAARARREGDNGDLSGAQGGQTNLTPSGRGC